MPEVPLDFDLATDLLLHSILERRLRARMYFWLDLEEPGVHGLVFQKVLRCRDKGTVHHDARTLLVVGLWVHRTDVNPPVNRVLDP